jgi:hypothetical protein
MFISSIFKHVTPSKATLLLTSLYLLARTGRLRIPQSLKLFIGFLFMLNWQNWPLYWHFRVFVFPVLQVKKDQLLAFLGILSEKTRRLKQLQLPAKEWQHAAIGLSPFAAVSYTSSKASWARSDAFGMHFSNSNYLQEMDLARFAYYSRYLQGPAQDGLLLAVGGTSNVYFSPIGLHQSFSVETRLAAYNDRWVSANLGGLSFPDSEAALCPAHLYSASHQVTRQIHCYPDPERPSSALRLGLVERNMQAQRRSRNRPPWARHIGSWLRG